MTEYIQEEIRRQAFREAYRLIEKHIVWNDDGTVSWTGRPQVCLSKLRILADRPVRPLHVMWETE